MFWLLIFFISFPSHAETAQPWAFKAFRGEKIQLDQVQSLSGQRPLLLIVDKSCLSQSFGKKAGLNISGLVVQHKSSANLEYPALTAIPDGTADLEQLRRNLAAEPCLIAVTENPVTSVAGSSVVTPALSAINVTGGEEFFEHPLWGIRENVLTAVIDSGIQMNHPDLSPRLWTGPGGERGFDFVNDDTDPSDDNGHGTHVAGLIASSPNATSGTRGVASYVRLMPVKSQGADGGGSLADVVNAIKWAADRGAQVINLSVTANTKNTAVEDAIQYAISKGAFLAAAAGNDGNEVTDSAFVLPSGYAKDYPGLVSVGSIDAMTLLRSSFSNFSASLIEIAAPGSVQGTLGLLSTYPGSTHRRIQGTSQATPQVSGAAALTIGFLKSQGITPTPAQVESAITVSAKQDSALSSDFSGGRRLDLSNLGRYLFSATWVDADGGFND